MPVPGQAVTGDTMQVLCTDGTTLQCERFEAIDSGVLLFGGSGQRGSSEEDAEEEESEEAMAFVPIHQLRFVLPDDTQIGPGTQPTSQRTQAGGQPAPGQPGAQTPPQGMTGQPTPPTQGTGYQSQSGQPRRQ